MNFSVQIRVRYAESDQMGVAYYSNYLVWFEISRVELMRELGIPYGEMEKSGLFLPVSESYCRYLAPCHFDDVLEIRCWASEIRTRAVRFEYELMRGKETVARGHTVHVCTDREARPVTFPDSVRDVLKKAIGPDPSA